MHLPERAIRLFGAAIGLSLRLLFGVLAVVIGSSIIVWVLYNAFVERQPEHSGWGFGIGPAMVGAGWHWLRGSRNQSSDSAALPSGPISPA